MKEIKDCQQYKIESGIEPTLKGRSKYPFDKMKNGDSFLVADKNERNRATSYARILLNLKVITRKNGKGYRIWIYRTEDKTKKQVV